MNALKNRFIIIIILGVGFLNNAYSEIYTDPWIVINSNKDNYDFRYVVFEDTTTFSKSIEYITCNFGVGYSWVYAKGNNNYVLVSKSGYISSNISYWLEEIGLLTESTLLADKVDLFNRCIGLFYSEDLILSKKDIKMYKNLVSNKKSESKDVDLSYFFEDYSEEEDIVGQKFVMYRDPSVPQYVTFDDLERYLSTDFTSDGIYYVYTYDNFLPTILYRVGYKIISGNKFKLVFRDKFYLDYDTEVFEHSLDELDGKDLR